MDIANRLDDETAARAVADCIDDSKVLGELVRTSNNSFLINYVLDRLDDLEVLRGIAIDEQRKDVALSALGRIADRSFGSGLTGYTERSHDTGVRGVRSAPEGA